MTKPIARRLLTGLPMLLFGLVLLAATAANATPGDTLYVQRQAANLYQTPTLDAPVIKQLGRGHKLKEFRRQGSWVKVIVYGEIGKEGWIRNSDVGLDDPGAISGQSAEPETRPIGAPAGPTKPKTKPESAPPFVLSMKGIATRFRANCVIINQTGDKIRRTLSDTVPKAYSFDAKAISCWVRNTGQAGILLVRLKKGTRVIAGNSAREWLGYVKVRSRGPWGRAYSQKCNRTKRRCFGQSRPNLF